MYKLGSCLFVQCLLFFLAISVPTFGQPNTSNGIIYGPHNRIEQKRFDWRVFRTSTFRIYFPSGADSLPAAIAKEILPAGAVVQKRMGVAALIPKAIIVYPSLIDQYESSIGIRELGLFRVPTFISRGSRVVLSYNGSYEDLKAQLYTGIVRATWERELGIDGNVGKQVQQTIRSDGSVPSWFKEGAIGYFAHGWQLEDENSLKRIFELDSPSSFFDLVSRRPELLGAAFCYYLSFEVRGDAPQQIISQLKKGKSLDRSLRLVSKQSAEVLYKECFTWFQQRNNASHAISKDGAITGSSIAPEVNVLPFAILKRGTIINYLLDATGKKLAVTVSFSSNKRTVYISDLASHSIHKGITYRLPPWIKNHESDAYPLISWSSTGDLFVAYPKRGKLKVEQLNGKGKITTSFSLPLIDGLSRIIPLTNNEFLLCAWSRGQTDLIVYSLKRDKFIPITNTASDEAEPSVFLQPTASGRREQSGEILNSPIYFTSFRKGDTAFFQDSLSLRHGIYKSIGGKVFPIITDTTNYLTFTKPILLDPEHLLLTTTKNGSSRLSIIDLKYAEEYTKSSTATINRLQILDSDYEPYQYLPHSGLFAFFREDRDTISLSTIPFNQWIDEKDLSGKPGRIETSQWLLDYRSREASRRAEDSILQAARIAGGPSVLEEMVSTMSPGSKSKESDRIAGKYDRTKTSAYFLQLHSAYFSAQVNNDYIISRYQPYSAYQGTFKFPEIGALTKAGLSDLFEHHHLSFAYRLPAGSVGSMFFAKYGNSARRFDWNMAYFRNIESVFPDPARIWTDPEGRPYPNTLKVKTHYGEVSGSYPLSYYTAVGTTVFLRTDRTVFLATDNYSLKFPALTELWMGIPVWGESKHLSPTLASLFRGWQARIQGDFFKSFSGSESSVMAARVSAQWHKPLYRYITLVLKGEIGFSGGDKKILYNLGGVDNNLTPRIDSTVHFRQNAPFAFQTLVAPFRGYRQNSLFGSQFAMINADLYLPIFESLIPIETAFSSINHLQIGLSFDCAQASGNPNYTTANKGLIYSYGISARTNLAGYPLRFDLNWPGTFSSQPIWYFSLNL